MDDVKKRAKQSNKPSILKLMFEDFILCYQSGGFFLASNASHITMSIGHLDTIEVLNSTEVVRNFFAASSQTNELEAKTCMASGEGQITFGIDL